MIQITRSLARQVRAVFRKLIPRAAHLPKVSLTAGSDGLRIRLHHIERCAEYHHPGVFPADTIALPFEAFADFEGRTDEPVILEVIQPGTVQVLWQDSGVPQAKDYEAEDITQLPALPLLPEPMAGNEPGFLRALADATQSASHDAIRYAVDHLQLQSNGTIAATDGRQLLIQAGFHFPWTENVLVPASPVFACKELPQDLPVSIGTSDSCVTLRVGPWTLHLLLNKERRFPHVETVVPKPKSVRSFGLFDSEDSAFLVRTLPHLPGGDDENAPITLDLNEQLYVRAKESKQSRVTELVLARSKCTGRPVRINVDRNYLMRAVQLGFHELQIVDANSAVLFQDERRKYVVMPIAKEGILLPSEDAIRIVSTAEVTVNHHQPMKRSPVVNEPQTNGAPTNVAPTNGAAETNGATAVNAVVHAGSGVRRRKAKSTGLGALIEEAEALKSALRDAFSRSHKLYSALKRQRKQSKIVQSSLQALKHLQNVE